MDMTFEQYILNPMGKNNAVLNASTREIIRAEYIRKFDNILLRESGRIEYYLYTDSKSNTYWAHIKVPSEVVKDFYYDVVLKFYTDEKGLGAGQDLFKYNVNFYSNDPAFVFTYAHVFLVNKLFVKELSSKMSREAITKGPKEKNPSNSIGYVKALYFAYLIMQNKKLNKLSKFKGESKPLDIKSLVASVEDADEKIRQRQEKDVSTKKKIVLDDNTMKNVSKYIGKDTNTDRLAVTTTKHIGTIKNSNKSTKIKSVKSSKKK